MPIIWDDKSTPKEIDKLIKKAFELYEIRATVDKKDGVKFIIFTNEHYPPHVHLQYAEFKIKISLIDFKIISGNLPKRKQEFAINWIKENYKKFLSEWDKYTNLSASAYLTKSRLKEELHK